MADKSGIHVVEESSSGVVPAKCPNKSVRAQAEGMEERPLAKENTLQQPRSGHSARMDEYVGCEVCGREAQRFSFRHGSKVGTGCVMWPRGLCGAPAAIPLLVTNAVI